MQKLSIRVHKCHLMRPVQGDSCCVNPRVVVVVDGTYRFQTSVRKSTFSPEYRDVFVVGNTHRRAVVEVSVYDVPEPTGLLLSGIGAMTNRHTMTRSSEVSHEAEVGSTASNGAADITAGETGTGSSSTNGSPPVLLGRCYISVQRLVHRQRKRRTYFLATPMASSFSAKSSVSSETLGPTMFLHQVPKGITGMIVLSLESDTLGEPPSSLILNEELEAEYVRRLKRFFLRYDKPKLAMLDVLMAHVRDETELPQREREDSASSMRRLNGGQGGGRGTEVENSILSPLQQTLESTMGGGGEEEHGSDCPASTTHICLGGCAELTADLPNKSETFSEMMERLRVQYNGAEPSDFKLAVRVMGCTNIERDAWNISLLGSDDVAVVLRTEGEEFVSGEVSLQNTMVWLEGNTTTFDVVNPSTFYILVIVMGRCSSKYYEMGRSRVSAAPLSSGHLSYRNMFLCAGESMTDLSVNGMVHTSLQPVNFCLTPIDMAPSVDDFYDRFGKFFRRYDPLRLPEVDYMVRARLGELETFMEDLVVVYGREPGAVRLLVTIDSIVSLRESADCDLSGKSVCAIITMGSATVRTKPLLVNSFVAVTLKESYLFDVVRETDLIRIEIVAAASEDIVYGRVDFSCLNTQRGVSNNRDLYLVGAAGTPEGYFSGIVRVSLYSDEVGHRYTVDTELENSFAGRLRRFVHRRVPECLHRVNIAVATVFDMETFMSQLSCEYGDEDPTYALYCTVVGCRQLPSRFAGIKPYVVVRVGIDAYQTKTAKDNTEPDFFEFCEFYYDRPGDMTITLVVMDRSDIGTDEEIGRAVIPLEDVQPSHQYNVWLPLLNTRKRSGRVREVGTIGFKYSVVDLNLVDRTRMRLVKQSRCMRGGSSIVEGQRDVSASGLASTTNDVRTNAVSSLSRTANQSITHRWNNFKRYFTAAGLVASAMRSTTSADAVNQENRSTNGTTHVIHEAEHSPGRSRRSGKHQTTFNLMDFGINSIEDFCGAETSRAVSTIHSETDFGLSPRNDSDFLSIPNSRDTSMLGSIVNTVSGNCGRSVGAESMLLCDDMHSDAPITLGGDTMVLRVRLLSCTALWSPGRNAPSPYVLLSTLCQSHRSQVQFHTTEPRFDESFTFVIDDPSIDFLCITVLSDTPYGSKKLGHCTMSLANVQRGAVRTRWTALVVDSFESHATERGSVYLSLGGINFGLDHLPSADAENRLRERVREYLIAMAPEQLHRLEWYVGKLSQLESVMLGDWLNFQQKMSSTKADKSSSYPKGQLLKTTTAAVEVAVKSISHLHHDGFLAEGTCTVKVKVNGHTRAKVRSIEGSHGDFAFDASTTNLRFTVDNPITTVLRICVQLNGKVKSGECYLSLLDLHRSVPKERTLMLVTNARTSNAQAVGLINIAVTSETFGSAAPPPSDEDLAQHARLMRYFYYYLPADLALVDVKYAATLNVEAYLSILVEKYGPEPHNYQARVTVDRSTGMRLGKSDSSAHLFCIVRIGLQEFHSSIVQGTTECVFCESFELVVGLPEIEKVDLILMRFYPSSSEELGRTQISLSNIQKGVNNVMQLALVSEGGTKCAALSGSMKVTVFTRDFGFSEGQHFRTPSTFFYQPAEHSSHSHISTVVTGMESPRVRAYKKLSGTDATAEVEHSAPRWQGYRGRMSSAGRSLVAMPSNEGSFVDATTLMNGSTASGADSGRHATVTIIGFAGLTLRDTEVYVRVSKQSTTLLKTKPIAAENLVALDASISTFQIKDASQNLESFFTLKLGVSKLLGTVPLCYADFSIVRCTPEMSTTKHLRLYDVENNFIGICRMRVSMPKVAHPLMQRKAIPPVVLEPLTDDIASLVATYTPKDLRRLDVTISVASDYRRLHRGLRLQLASSVVATVYVAIHEVSLPTATIRHCCTVSASVGSYTTEAQRRQVGSSSVYPYGMSRKGVSALDYPLMRVDISATGPNALLTLRVSDQASKTKTRELGRTVVSLRALLTPKVYDMSEKVQVPLVSVRYASNKAHATLQGTITFSIIPPAFESYLASVRFPSSVVEDYSREYVRYYMRRICHLLKHYDANSLVDIHAKVYETYIGNQSWAIGLPDFLAESVVRWGPETEKPTPPPTLQRDNEQNQPLSEAVEENNPDSVLSTMVNSPVELAPPVVHYT